MFVKSEQRRAHSSQVLVSVFLSVCLCVRNLWENCENSRCLCVNVSLFSLYPVRASVFVDLNEIAEHNEIQRSEIRMGKSVRWISGQACWLVFYFLIHIIVSAPTLDYIFLFSFSYFAARHCDGRNAEKKYVRKTNQDMREEKKTSFKKIEIGILL